MVSTRSTTPIRHVLILKIHSKYKNKKQSYLESFNGWIHILSLPPILAHLQQKKMETTFNRIIYISSHTHAHLTDSKLKHIFAQTCTTYNIQAPYFDLPFTHCCEMCTSNICIVLVLLKSTIYCESRCKWYLYLSATAIYKPYFSNTHFGVCRNAIPNPHL